MPEMILTIRRATVYAILLVTVALVFGYCVAALVDFITEVVDTFRIRKGEIDNNEEV